MSDDGEEGAAVEEVAVTEESTIEGSVPNDLRMTDPEEAPLSPKTDSAWDGSAAWDHMEES